MHAAESRSGLERDVAKQGFVVAQDAPQRDIRPNFAQALIGAQG
jgi:hypothetical protein